MKLFRRISAVVFLICGVFFLLLTVVFVRLISLPVLLTALILSSHSGTTPRRRICAKLALLAFFLSLLSPVDIDFPPVGRFMHYGERRNGLRLVPVVYGMPAHSFLRKKYREYYTGGCGGGDLGPKWILAWD
jgi:hypothetical protein